MNRELFHQYKSGAQPVNGGVSNAYGVTLKQFVKELRPYYLTVWRDLFIAYLVVTVVILLQLTLESAASGISYFFMLITAITVAWFFAYIALFLHEGAHFNLTKNRKINDVLTNLICGLPLGQNVMAYRKIHMAHHKYLGKPQDPENSYKQKLCWKFILSSIAGFYSIEMIISRIKNIKNIDGMHASYFNILLFVSISLHLLIITIFIYVEAYQTMFAYVLGACFLYPFLGALRNLLEHRSPERENAQHVITRMFSNNIIDRLFGAAGFNSHLLHHWVPNISYTRFSELESFFRKTELAPLIDTYSSTYYKSFIDIFNK